MNELVKLNLGGGPKRIDGYLNVDALDWNGATDVKIDLTRFPWGFNTDSIDEILAVEMLEHISFRFTKQFLSECYRILKPGGIIKIQVPDCGKAMQYYMNNQICECVPHKAKEYSGYKANPVCFACGGKGMIHPDRWLFSFTGAQKHEYDIHRNIFTKESLYGYLRGCYFKNIKFEDNIYKLIVSAVK